MLNGFLILKSLYAQSLDPRARNHGICIEKFTNAGDVKYYLTWSSSFGVDWEHDIYNQTIHFENGNLIVDSPPTRYIGNGADEAQEPVNCAIDDENGGDIILTAWEDGSGSTIDVRGQLHNSDGSITKANWIIAGGDESQHSAAVAHFSDYFLVAYADEAPPAQHAMIKAIVVDDQNGTAVDTIEFTLPEEDHWWPVACDNGENRVFVGWGDGYEFFGSVIHDDNGSITVPPPISYMYEIDQYHYQVEWLQEISRFIAVVKSAGNSQVALIDTAGTLINDASINAPIIREARMAVRWNSFSSSYKVVYPTGTRDLAVLDVKASNILLEKIHIGTNDPDLSSITWPEHGTWGRFVEDLSGQQKNLALFAFNDEMSNNAKLVSVKGIIAESLLFRVERTTGDVFTNSSFIGSGADLAERINVSEPVELGDVIELDPTKPQHYRKARGSSQLIAGVITTEPGFTLGNSSDEMMRANAIAGTTPLTIKAAGSPMLALMGRVPVKATTENGVIQPGDRLMISSKPGYATLCTQTQGCKGAIIGKALEGLASGEGMILVLVMAH